MPTGSHTSQANFATAQTLTAPSGATDLVLASGMIRTGSNVPLQADEIRNREQAIKILSGFIAKVRIRCGKSNCRCTRGTRHVAHYHVTYSGGVRLRKYIRREFVAEVRDACQAYRTIQAQLRAGRAEYKQALSRVREFSKRPGQ